MDILNNNKLLAAVTLLLPGMTMINQLWSIHCNIKTRCCLVVHKCQCCKTDILYNFDLKDAIPVEALQPGPPSGETYSALPTRLLDNAGALTASSCATTQILLDSRDPEPTGEPFRNLKLSRNDL